MQIFPTLAANADENEDPSLVHPTMQGSDLTDSKEVEKNTIESINSDGNNLVSCDAIVASASDDTSDTAVSSASIAANDSASDAPDTAIRASRVPPKRKRPPKIEIPSYMSELRFHDRERGESNGKEKETVSSFGSGVAVYSFRGRRKKQLEDRFNVVRGFNGDLKKSFFGVYDGHGGRKAAKFVAENLHENVLEVMEDSEGNLGKEEVMKAAYLKTDSEFLKLGSVSGTCCVTCLAEEKEITVSNLGDCRAVLCRVDGVAEALTKDHKAGDEDERRRIEQMGGYVVEHRGAWRVHGDLAISRSIGDAHLKRWVLAEPDTKVLNITPDMEFLILASDGLWDKVSNQEALDITKLAVAPIPTRDILNTDKKKFDYTFGWENTNPPSKASRTSSGEQQKTPAHESSGVTGRPSIFRLMTACERLVYVAVKRGSSDDITVMIIDLMQLRCIS